MKASFLGKKAVAFRALHAVQQRAAITTPEAGFMLVIAGVLLVGTAVRYVGSSAGPVDPSAYAALDAALAAAVPAPRAEPLALPEAAESEGTESEAAERSPVATSDAGRPASSRPARLAPVPTNVNTASAAQLQRLPGIGPALAQRIVEHRELHGPFARPSDLTRVRGIGPKTFERLEPFVRVE